MERLEIRAPSSHHAHGSLLIAWMVLLAGCGGSSERSAISSDDFGREYAEVACAAAVRCLSLPDVEACVETSFLALIEARFRASAAHAQSGTVSYDAAAAARCIEAIDAQSCEIGSFYSEVKDACATVFVGLVAEGASCFDDVECVTDECDLSSPTCDNGTMCCTGVCGPRRPAVGESCEGLSCEFGVNYCDTTSTPAVCRLPAPEGAVCSFTKPCKPELYCVGAETGAGTCKSPAVTGEPCEVACRVITDWCNPASQVCEPRLGLGSACPAESYSCVGFASCEAETCVEKGRPGEKCAETDPCMDGLSCVGGGCRPHEISEEPICS